MIVISLWNYILMSPIHIQPGCPYIELYPYNVPPKISLLDITVYPYDYIMSLWYMKYPMNLCRSALCISTVSWEEHKGAAGEWYVDHWNIGFSDVDTFWWMLMDLHGCLWVWMDDDGFSWMLMIFDGFEWMLMDFGGFEWMMMDFRGFEWMLMDVDAFWWMLMDVDTFWWMLMDLNGCWWIWMDDDGFSLDVDEFWWIWMDADGFWWVWMDVHGCSWMFMDVDECSWMLMDVDAFWWMLMDVDGFESMLIDFHGFSDVDTFWWMLMDLMDLNGCWWILVDLNGCWWMLMHFDGCWWVRMDVDGFSWIFRCWYILMDVDGSEWMFLDVDGFLWLLMDFAVFRVCFNQWYPTTTGLSFPVKACFCCLTQICWVWLPIWAPPGTHCVPHCVIRFPHDWNVKNGGILHCWDNAISSGFTSNYFIHISRRNPQDALWLVATSLVFIASLASILIFEREQHPSKSIIHWWTIISLD